MASSWDSSLIPPSFFHSLDCHRDALNTRLTNEFWVRNLDSLDHSLVGRFIIPRVLEKLKLKFRDCWWVVGPGYKPVFCVSIFCIRLALFLVSCLLVLDGWSFADRTHQLPSLCIYGRIASGVQTIWGKMCLLHFPEYVRQGHMFALCLWQWTQSTLKE